MAPPRFRNGLRCAELIARGLVLSQPLGCSEDDPDAYQPLSQQCEACLQREGASGCGSELDACEELASCESLILCELRQQCYTMPSGDCSRDRGCEDSVDADALELASQFEDCARDTCDQSCDFVP